jgi:hypothetical protein
MKSRSLRPHLCYALRSSTVTGRKPMVKEEDKDMTTLRVIILDIFDGIAKGVFGKVLK